MDLLLFLLLFAAALLAVGWVTKWLLFGVIVALCSVVAFSLGLLAHPFARVKDPRSKGRDLKREVLLSSLPGNGRNTSTAGGLGKRLKAFEDHRHAWDGQG